MIRLSIKVRFLVGLAHRITEINGVIGLPQVRDMLGQLAAESSMIDALVAAMEAKGTHHGRYFVPDRPTLYAAEILTQQLYPKILNTLRELAGRRHDNAAFLGRRFPQSGNCLGHRAQSAITDCECS
jgi:4-hydroxyphenylacetate 3-monooxygenase